MTRAKFTAKGTQGTRSRECPGWLPDPIHWKGTPTTKAKIPPPFFSLEFTFLHPLN